jgi:hypothetical protein
VNDPIESDRKCSPNSAEAGPEVGSEAGAGASTEVGTRRPGASRSLAQVLILAGYLAGAIAVTGHLWPDPAGRIVAGNPHDADLFAWYLRYAATSVAHGQLPALITSRLNAPQGVSVLWNTSLLLPGILLAPVTLLAGPQVSLTVLMTAGFAGSAAAMMAVLKRWQLSLGAAALAGAIYGFSPALVQSGIGHYNLQFAVLPPLIVDAGLRLFIVPAGPGQTTAAGRRQSIGAGVWLGVLAAAQFFIAEEMLALSALAGIILALCLAVLRPATVFRQLRDLRWLAGTAAAAVVTLLILGVALLTQFAGPLTQHGSPFLIGYFKNDLTVFVDPSGYVLWHTAASAAAAAALPGGASEQLGYLGWPMIVVLAVGFVVGWRDRRIPAFALTVLALDLLSLGAHPQVAGMTDQHLTLPWQWLADLPVLALALPERLSILADGVAAVLIALLFDWSVRAARAAWPGRSATVRLAAVRAAIVLVAVLPLVPAPLPAVAASRTPADFSAALASLRLASGATVLVVPVPDPTLTDPMRWQAATGADISLIGGYFIGPAWNGLAYVGGNGPRPTATYLDALWLASPAGRRAEPDAAPSPPPGRPPLATVRSDLAYWKPAAVLADTTAGTALGRYLTSILGTPTVQAGQVMAWRLPSAPG